MPLYKESSTRLQINENNARKERTQEAAPARGSDSLLPRGEAQQRPVFVPPALPPLFPLMTFSLGSLVVVAGRARGQPGGHGAGAGLLGHAVVADDGVEPAPGVGILCRVVGVQRGGDAALVLGGGRERSTVRPSGFFLGLLFALTVLQLPLAGIY